MLLCPAFSLPPSSSQALNIQLHNHPAASVGVLPKSAPPILSRTVKSECALYLTAGRHLTAVGPLPDLTSWLETSAPAFIQVLKRMERGVWIGELRHCSTRGCPNTASQLHSGGWLASPGDCGAQQHDADLAAEQEPAHCGSRRPSSPSTALAPGPVHKTQDGNWGLLQLALQASKARAVRRLTKVYTTIAFEKAAELVRALFLCPCLVKWM